MATRVAYLETEAIIPGRESWASVSIGSSRSTKCHQVLTVLTKSRAAAQRVAAQRAATQTSCGQKPSDQRSPRPEAFGSAIAPA